MENLMLLEDAEAALRLKKITDAMAAAGTGALLLADNANLYYLTGRVYDGVAYIDAAAGTAHFFPRRPVQLKGDNVTPIHKPEDITAHIARQPSSVGLELDDLCYSTIERYKALFPDARLDNASQVMRSARSVKTPREVEKMRRSGISQQEVYHRIPRLFTPGMTDIELQVEIERVSRLEGCLGQFRISGDSMELFMANILAGDNADAPSPYDFAMGGAGADPSLPVGADGSEIKPGMTVMADVNGNFTGYMTDMTRVYSLGTIAPLALKAHQCSIDIHNDFIEHCRPGVKASELYERALDIATQAGLEHYFMGHRQHARFVGHGLGIEINELPVIAPRSRDIIAVGQAIALEPKFVIPGTGAVGIENTYIVKEDSLECLTNAPWEIIALD